MQRDVSLGLLDDTFTHKNAHSYARDVNLLSSPPPPFLLLVFLPIRISSSSTIYVHSGKKKACVSNSQQGHGRYTWIPAVRLCLSCPILSSAHLVINSRISLNTYCNLNQRNNHLNEISLLFISLENTEVCVLSYQKS